MAVPFRVSDEALQNAFEAGELVVQYQVRVRLATRRPAAVEALVQWQRPDRSLTPAAAIAPALERTGLDVPVGQWAFAQLCTQLADWHKRDVDGFGAGIRITARQLKVPDLAERLRAEAAAAKIPTDWIHLEVPERSLADADATRTLARFKADGFKLTIGDFSGGASSPGALRRARVDALKLDPALVRDIDSDPDAAAAVRGLLALARELNINVTADGIDRDAQAALVARAGCDEAQGGLFTLPVTADECAALLAPDRTFGVIGLSDEDATVPERTLLLLDDEPNVLAALRRTLRHDGYRVLYADSAMRALELLAQHSVGVVISDQRMPHMGGVEFLSRVKALHPHTIRLVLSGYTDLATVTDAVNRGAIYKFITKPWDDSQLRELIREAFVHFELSYENERLARSLQAANNRLAEANEALSAAYNEKAREAELSRHSLHLVRELLEHVPAPVIGIGADGLIALANHSAERAFADGAPLIGAWAAECLPGPVAALAAEMPGTAVELAIGNVRYHGKTHALADNGTERGKLMVFMPIAPLAELAPCRP